MTNLQRIFDQNQAWSEAKVSDNPDYFADMAEGQSPEYLWLGCADSRVPAARVTGLEPGELFVHRNIANVIVHSDINSLSVIQYAVEVLKVKHVVVCGHYGCGGVKAAMEGEGNSLIFNWLRHINDVERFHEAELAKLTGDEKFNRLCELNVAEQALSVANSTPVQTVWAEGSDLEVHGIIYDLKSGRLKDLGVNFTSATNPFRNTEMPN